MGGFLVLAGLASGFTDFNLNKGAAGQSLFFLTSGH
jgi:hypothetical protein